MRRLMLLIASATALAGPVAMADTLAILGADLRAFRECAAIATEWRDLLPAAARTLILESETRIVLVSDDDRWLFGAGALRLSEEPGETGDFAAMQRAVEDELFTTIQCLRKAELAGSAGPCSYASILSYARGLPEGVTRDRLQALIGERINALGPEQVRGLLSDPALGQATLEALQAFQELESDRLESLGPGRTILESGAPDEVRQTIAAFLRGTEPRRVLESGAAGPAIRLRGADGVEVFVLGFAGPADPGALGELLVDPRALRNSEGLRVVFSESPFGPLHEIRLDADALQRITEGTLEVPGGGTGR